MYKYEILDEGRGGRNKFVKWESDSGSLGQLICHRFCADFAFYHQSPQEFYSMPTSNQILFIFVENLISGKTCRGKNLSFHSI